MKIYVFALLVVTAVVIAIPIKESISDDEDLRQNKGETLKLRLVPNKQQYQPSIFCIDELLVSDPLVSDPFCHTNCITEGSITGKCLDNYCVCYIYAQTNKK